MSAIHHLLMRSIELANHSRNNSSGHSNAVNYEFIQIQLLCSVEILLEGQQQNQSHDSVDMNGSIVQDRNLQDADAKEDALYDYVNDFVKSGMVGPLLKLLLSNHPGIHLRVLACAATILKHSMYYRVHPLQQYS